MGSILLLLLLQWGCATPLGLIDTADEEPSNQALHGQILVWFSFPQDTRPELVQDFERSLQEAAQEFQNIHANVNIVIEFFPEEEAIAQFIAQNRQGFGPDILYTYNIKVPTLIESGTIRSFAVDQFDLSSYWPETLEHVQVGDQLYALPVFLRTQVLCYNRSRVDQPPQTLDQLAEQAKKGYSVGLPSSFAMTAWGVGLFGGNNASLSKQVTAWAKWIEWLKDARAAPNIILSSDTASLSEAFATGNLTYLACASEEIPLFRQALGQENLGVTFLPHTDQGKPTPPPRVTVVVFNKASSPQQATISLRLGRFLTNAEQQKRVILGLQSIASVNQNVIIDRRLYPIAGTVAVQSQLNGFLEKYNLSEINELLLTAEPIYEKAISGEISPGEAAQELQTLIIDIRSRDDLNKNLGHRNNDRPRN
ncbi:extracellular solute-binding protein [Candidatus Synechococcus calcipolaris G9]|uniref:Extracellular solute-binding protein n=1 Tax=Candidatus Synechococcus calcipolaris G9 TaxID=1497997 RepID=A0ABT6F421_9SYNE|nr:extracellular solute-binding protein [Candidatus Synechococcus calcipolaris]MDG2992458.1 extracellular solute-binding protein [Candidatus Synechococcus calcipolaris G9]